MNRILIYLSLSLIILSSCKDKAPKQTFLPSVTGGMNDVVLVMSPQNWDTEAGEAIRRELLQQVQAVPQDERVVDIVWMPHDAFTKVVKKQRNVIITKIGPDYEAGMKIHKSLWAQSQIVVQLTAKNPEEFIDLIQKQGPAIISEIQKAELERLMSSYRKNREASIVEKLEKDHEVKLVVPKGYTVNLEDENFIWLDNRHRNVIEGILVYYYPYTDSSTFTEEFLVAKRDAILKKYVPGETEGSYAVTEHRFPLITSQYELNGKRYTYEIRGLWHVLEGMAMGGSFVSITQFDEARGRIVTVDGFLFAPGEDKRNLIKRLDAILYSLDFPEKKKEENTVQES